MNGTCAVIYNNILASILIKRRFSFLEDDENESFVIFCNFFLSLGKNFVYN